MEGIVLYSIQYYKKDDWLQKQQPLLTGKTSI